jgi:pre-mRNA-splicing helicase BRR2
MSDDAARLDQYSYAATSNLVLSRQGGSRPAPGTATGEVKTLWGTSETAGKGMGGALKRSRDDKEAVKNKAKKVAKAARDVTAQDAAYTPSSQATTARYLQLLTTLKKLLGSQDTAVMSSAAEEVLEVVYGESAAKQKDIADVLGTKVANEDYAKLYADAKGCTDYTTIADKSAAAGDADDDAVDEDMGVAVVFDSDEEEEDEDGNNVQAEIVDVDDDDSDAEDGGNVVTTAGAGAAGEAAKLSVHHISVDFVSRLLSPHYSADALPGICSQVMELLPLPDSREVENKLCVLLGFDKFDTCRTLTADRHRIYYVTLYRRAGDDEKEREKAVEKMGETEQGRQVLQELNTKEEVSDIVGKSRIDSVIQSQQEEARTIRAMNAKAAAGGGVLVGGDDDDVEMAPAAAAGGAAPTLDLDNLAFKDGARTMTNDKCTLPKESWRAMKPG